MFAVFGDHLALRQVIGSGGTFPVSIAVHGGLVYVLNAENGGEVQGFVSFFGRLLPLPGSGRALGLNPNEEPQFTHTPGQVAFSPDGRQLIVTTKGNGSDIDVFAVAPFGRLSATPVVNSEPGAVPFAVTFDQEGHLIVADAGTNALSGLRAERQRHAHPARRGGDRPGSDLLGGRDERALLRLQRRQRIVDGLSVERRRSAADVAG